MLKPGVSAWKIRAKFKKKQKKQNKKLDNCWPLYKAPFSDRGNEDYSRLG